MSESNREHLSCLMDGELDSSGQKFLLRRMAEDADMKAAWRRFHTVRACLHREERLVTRDLAADVAAALEDEPLPAHSSSMARWLRPVAGSAIAASVALMAIVGINSSMLQQDASSPAGDQPGFVSQPTSLDQPFTRSAVPVSYSEETRSERQRISGYVLRHHQASGAAGFVSYVPIVTGMSEDPPRDEPVTRDADAADR